MSAPAGANVVRGPWEARATVPETPDPDRAARAQERRREAVRAQSERLSGSAAVAAYEALMRRVVAARYLDPIAATNAVCDLLASLDDEELRAMVRQRLAGHRIR